MIKAKPYMLKNSIQNYAWGSKGPDSFIPKLLGFDGENNQAYAELWIGAHPKAPSMVVTENGEIPLNEFISQFPVEILGKSVAENFSNKLPFLLKVLSAGEALSIQAHPNKFQAEILHRRDPEHYPDDNHKPEIAIALDELTALAGFRTIPAISESLKKYPEMAGFVGQKEVTTFQNITDKFGLQQFYCAFMQKSQEQPAELVKAADALAIRLEKQEKRSEAEDLFLELRKKYGSEDVGLFALFLLDLRHLKTGQAIFLEAGIPHAYLKGNIIECMANSDNVVRAGLTPKFKDISTLVDILTYDTEPIPVIEGKTGDDVLYPTPVPEFQLRKLQMKTGLENTIQTENKPEIIIVTEGKIEVESLMIKRGETTLIPAIVDSYTIKAVSDTTIFKVEIP